MPTRALLPRAVLCQGAYSRCRIPASPRSICPVRRHGEDDQGGRWPNPTAAPLSLPATDRRPPTDRPTARLSAARANTIHYAPHRPLRAGCRTIHCVPHRPPRLLDRRADLHAVPCRLPHSPACPPQIVDCRPTDHLGSHHSGAVHRTTAAQRHRPRPAAPITTPSQPPRRVDRRTELAATPTQPPRRAARLPPTYDRPTD